MSLDGFSLVPLVQELNSKLMGGRIDKIFQPDKDALLIGLRLPGENIKLYISANPEQPNIFLTKKSPENPPVPPVFCMLLRKHLEDGRLAGVCQHAMDRIITLHVDVRGESGAIITKSLIIELMGKHSNMILIENNTIIDALKRINTAISRYRQVLPGKLYTLPPGQERLNIFDFSEESLVNSLVNYKGSLLKAIINTYMGIGPLTAREIAWRSGVPTELPAESLTFSNISALKDAIISISSPIKQGIIEPTVIVGNNDNRLIGVTAFVPDHLRQHSLYHYCSMSEAINASLNFQKKINPSNKEYLTKILTNEINRLLRKKEILQQELEEAQKAPLFRLQADILMANLHILPLRSSQVTLANCFSDNPDQELISISLDPLYTPLENAQSYYSKFGKLKRAQESLRDQLAQCSQNIAYLESINISLSHAENLKEIGEILQEIVAAGYIRQQKKTRSDRPSNPLTAVTHDGFSISVGKNNYQNDLLTFKQSQADDIWLHTKDIPGSHVILRTGKQNPTPEALEEAAQLAAYFSKARSSANVPVDYTRRRYVKKPVGAKPGFVIYDHHSTIYVTPDESVVKSMLKSER